MALILGPMPASVRAAVAKLIADPSKTDGRSDWFYLSGGPSGCSYLDTEGEVSDWSAWDDSIVRIEDGPIKVGLVAIGAEREPSLAEWLPRRALDAIDCPVCAGSRKLSSPYSWIQCQKCNGLGWVSPSDCL
jgi:hypothetical protein